MTWTQQDHRQHDHRQHDHREGAPAAPAAAGSGIAWRIFCRALDGAFTRGRLTLVGPEGQVGRFGPGTNGPEVTLGIRDGALLPGLLVRPQVTFAEGYADGRIVLERGTLDGLVDLAQMNPGPDRTTVAGRSLRLLRSALQQARAIDPRAARRNAAAHYDIGNDVYRRFLDRDMHYSCAYFRTGGETIEEAQRAKARHIVRKLRLRPGDRVLDIGCGWGSMALEIAAAEDVEVVGVSLAERQVALARERAAARGLSDRVRFELSDYRDVRGSFERIVSVGMMEHVGSAALPGFMATIRERLAPDGVALVHSIFGIHPPSPTDDFIRRHIFPGGYIPSMSKVFAAVESAGLWPLDAEIWRLHYARTLAAWSERFRTHRGEIRELMGERFCRIWEIYLSGCRATFEHGSSAVVQLQIGRERDAAPLTRDYLCD